MFSTVLALGIIALQIFIIVVTFGLISKAAFVSKISKYSQKLLLLIFWGSTLASLIYQYGYGFEPCVLCWYQRIFIIGISILLLTDNILKSSRLRKQVLIFAVVGLIIAVFHNIIDIFPTGLDTCGATGPSCLARYVYEFGYITIPMMSFTALLSGILIVLSAKRYPQDTIAQ